MMVTLPELGGLAIQHLPRVAAGFLLHRRQDDSSASGQDPQSEDPHANEDFGTGATTQDTGGMYNAIMGKWVYVEFTLDSLSIFLSLLVIATVVCLLFTKREIALKPSFRLSAWIAAVDIILAACKIARLFNRYMSTISEAEVRFIAWTGYFTTLAFMFLTCCIVLQLQLTVLHNKPHVAACLNPYYEAVSLVLAAVLTQPTIYALGETFWYPEYQAIAAVDPKNIGNKVAWGTLYAWVIAALAYMVVICGALVLKLWPVWSRMRASAPLPDPEPTKERVEAFRRQRQALARRGRDGPVLRRLAWWRRPPARDGSLESGDLSQSQTTYVGSDGSREDVCAGLASPATAVGPRSPPQKPSSVSPANAESANRQHGAAHATDRHRRQVRNTILRIMLYPLIPILTRTITTVAQIGQFSPKPIYLLNTLLPASQGILNFIAFQLNPSADEFYSWLGGTPLARRIARYFSRPKAAARQKSNGQPAAAAITGLALAASPCTGRPKARGQ